MSAAFQGKPLPDSVEANRLGCSCPAGKNGGYGNERGQGVVVDGVREWVLDPKCAVHSNPKWWYSTRAKKI